MRKWPFWMMGGVFAVGLVLAFWPFVAADRRMQAFCQQVSPGTAVAEVRSRAEQAGYDVLQLSDGRLLVDDPPSGGRRGCALTLDAGGKVARAEPVT